MSHFDRGFEFGGSLDDIVHAARDFGEKMKEMGPEIGNFWADAYCGPSACKRRADRSYFYPPTNSYSTRDGSLVFEFALAGMDEGAVSVAFQGDYLVLSAKAAPRDDEADSSGFSRRGFRPRDIDRQKYRVPAEDYLQDAAKAVFKNGVLTVTVPPKESEGAGIKIEIVKEGS